MPDIFLTITFKFVDGRTWEGPVPVKCTKIVNVQCKKL